jgi:HK97 family phage portal protein
VAVVQSEGNLLSAAPPWSPRFGIGSVRYPSGLVEDYAAIYRTQPNVRLVVNFLARNIAQLRLLAALEVSDSETKPLDRRHALSRTLRRPNQRTTRHRFVNAIVHDLGIFDRFYVLKARNTTTDELRLFRIPPQNMRPIGGSWLFPDAFETVGLTERREFPADSVIYVHGHDPEDPRGSLSPIESLRRILIEDQAAAEYRANYWQRGARVEGVIERPLDAPGWSPTARRRFLEELREGYAATGPEAGSALLLEEGMTWKEASFSAKDSEYLAARRLSREETAAAYHVSPLFVGILDHANFSNVSEQHRHLYTDTLGPWCDLIEEDLELQLLPEFGDLDPDETTIRFDLEEKLRGSFTEEATIIQTATGAPWMLRNEARARRGLPPVPGGDELVVPLNVLVGGQASPRDSAPPVGAASRRRGNRVPGARARGALPPAGTKAADELPRDLHGWHAKHVEILGEFFDRQAASVRSKIGAGHPIEVAFDSDRWNTELETDLAALAFSMSEEVATAAAETFGGSYDPALAEAWLRENARIAAEKVNATTLASLEDELDALAAAKARPAGTKDTAPPPDDGEDVDELDVVDGIFAFAAGARTTELAVTRTTAIGNFARKEGAEQAGVRHKVWRVNSSSSRHPELDGETVEIGDTFSNGLLWPGDPSGSADDTAGCVCSLEFEP